MEGATLGMNYGLNRMRQLGIKPSAVRLTGGGSNDPLWRQIAADIFQTEVVCLETAEGAALGGAIQAIWAYENSGGKAGRSLAEITDALVRTDENTRCRPAPENSAVYQQMQQLHDEASRSLRSGFFSHHRASL
jgi:xylulokinase